MPWKFAKYWAILQWLPKGHYCVQTVLQAAELAQQAAKNVSTKVLPCPLLPAHQPLL